MSASVSTSNQFSSKILSSYVAWPKSGCVKGNIRRILLLALTVIDEIGLGCNFKDNEFSFQLVSMLKEYAS